MRDLTRAACVIRGCRAYLSWSCKGGVEQMQGKTVVITGATSGIGRVAASALAAQGARMLLIARDRSRGEQTLKALRSANPDAAHVVHYADVSRLTELKRTAEAIAAEGRIDVLINNAGALFAARQVTGEAFEKTFATNHLSYFVVTCLLLPVLRKTPGSRIVSTASAAHRNATLDFTDLQMSRGYSAFGMYGRTKLMNILFTRELARRLEGSGVTANCLHPGFVNTRFADDNGGWLAFVVKAAKRISALTPEEGAKTLVYLASSPEVASVSGAYFVKCQPAQPMPQAQSDVDARRLWDVTAQLTGIGA
jgi:NAD(P)-dependent dehydrogenase (short-subunit alcohol dehydrogenase family)